MSKKRIKQSATSPEQIARTSEGPSVSDSDASPRAARRRHTRLVLHLGRRLGNRDGAEARYGHIKSHAQHELDEDARRSGPRE